MSVLLPGSHYPLGAKWDGEGVNFAIFSEHAERVELCLFSADGMHETKRLTMPGLTVNVRWSTAVLSLYCVVSSWTSIMGPSLARPPGDPRRRAARRACRRTRAGCG